MILLLLVALYLLYVWMTSDDADECPSCNGTGTCYSHTTPYPCSECRGTGYKQN